MMIPANDPALKSWVPVSGDSEFPIQNIPFGVFRRPDGEVVCGVAIGDMALDLAAVYDAGLFAGTAVARVNLFASDSLNALLALGNGVCREVRQRISTLLREDNGELRDQAELRRRALLRQDEIQPCLPVVVPNFVDFYSSKEHATNVGSMFRDPSNPLLPNWVHMPIGYNGRSSSVVVSGTHVHRPQGQTKADDAAAPSYGPCRLLDFELEVGFITGAATTLGTPVSTAQAAEHICGMVLVNDWSARDIQKWEYVPLGPFLGKSFATSVSPWIVTLDALEPFRTVGPVQDPEPLPYLCCQGDWALNLNLEVHLQSESMSEPACITRTNFKHMYWNMLQQLAHMTVNGTNIQTGDLYASGTVSGPTQDSLGSMLELCWKGTRPVTLPDGETRKFLADGDTVIMRGWCQGDGYRVGFGEVRGTILPAME